MTQNGTSEMEIRSRIGMAESAFYRRKKILTSKNINLATRKRLLKMYIWRVAMYGCETWSTTKNDVKRLEALEMWGWRRMEKVRWTDRKTNEEILEMVEEKRSMMAYIQRRRDGMFGHQLRYKRILEEITEGFIPGKRSRGRPRTTYIQNLQDDRNLRNYDELSRAAQDRNGWRLVTEPI